MPRLTRRRSLILGASAAALAAFVHRGAAQPEAVRGVVIFANDGKIPKGGIELFLTDPARRGAEEHRIAQATLHSNGTAERIEFAFELPQPLPQSATRQIVARLERPDGWLIARGRAKLRAGVPVFIRLDTVMY